MDSRVIHDLALIFVILFVGIGLIALLIRSTGLRPAKPDEPLLKKLPPPDADIEARLAALHTLIIHERREKRTTFAVFYGGLWLFSGIIVGVVTIIAGQGNWLFYLEMLGIVLMVALLMALSIVLVANGVYNETERSIRLRILLDAKEKAAAQPPPPLA